MYEAGNCRLSVYGDTEPGDGVQEVSCKAEANTDGDAVVCVEWCGKK